jgi:hypothetical protein
MGFTKLRELRDRFEQQWINGGFIFGYENEINENHNNDYPLLVVLPPTSELPATEGDVQEEYTFECLVVKPYYQNQAGSLDVVFSLLEQEALTWLQRVLDSYVNKEVILSPDSISVEREKELYNDKLIQVRLTFTLNAFSHSLLAIDEAFVKGLTPLLWLKADMGVKTEFFGGNEVVNKWIDQSGNANHFEQTTSAKKPLYKYEMSSNSYPYVFFDGTNDFLDCVNDSLDGTADGLNNGLSVFYVAKGYDGYGGYVITKNLDNAAKANFAVRISTQGGNLNWRTQVQDSDDDLLDYIYTSNSANQVSANGFTKHKTNHSVKSFENGSLVDVETNPDFDVEALQDLYPLRLGAARDTIGHLKVDIQEILIFEKELTVEEVTKLSDYLKHKYNI